MNDTLFAAAMAAAVLLASYALLLAPATSPAGVVLGVRVPRQRLAHPVVVGAVRAYRLCVALAGLLAAGAVLLWWDHLPVLVLAPLAPLAVSALAYALLRRRVVAAKRAQQWFASVDTAVSARISPKGEAPVSFPWPVFAASLAVLVLGMLYVMARWSDIPGSFPTHYGAGFEPDAWGEKTVGNALFGMLFGSGVTALMAVLARLSASRLVHERSDRSAAGLARSQAAREDASRGLAGLNLVLAVGLTVLQIAMLFPEFQSHVAAVSVVFLGCVLGCAAALVARSAALRSRAAAADGGVESPDNDHLFTWGMFYCNPEDPAVLVDKRAGVGVSFNYATWQGKAFAVLTVVVVAAAVSLPFLVQRG